MSTKQASEDSQAVMFSRFSGGGRSCSHLRFVDVRCEAKDGARVNVHVANKRNHRPPLSKRERERGGGALVWERKGNNIETVR